MSEPEPTIPTPTDDPETLEESLFEARSILQDALDQIAEAAYVIGVVRGILPQTADGDVEFDEDDLKNSEHPTLQKIGLIADAIYAALETLPEDDEEEGDEDEEGEEEEEG